MSSPKHEFNPKLDLMFERYVDVTPDQVWDAWTKPEHVVHWFTPAPWKTVDCEIDLRPGGRFYATMQSPEGQNFPNLGCYLEIVENQKLVWTNALLPGFRPAGAPDPAGKECNEFMFTAIVMMEAKGKGTQYTAIAMHREEEGRNKHEAMGFEHGWGAALDQLVAYMQKQ